MRTFKAIAVNLLFAATALAQPNPEDFDFTESEVEGDPLYHVELILFAYNEGNRAEEDFLHGLEDFRLGPRPKLLRLPSIELDSIFAADLGAEAGREDPGDLQSAPPAVDNSSAIATPADDLTVSDISAVDQRIELEQDALELFEVNAAQNLDLSNEDQALPAEFRTLKGDELELSDVRTRLNNLRAYRVLGHVGWVVPGVDTDRSVKLDLYRLGITNPKGTIEVYRRRFLHVVVDFDFFDGSSSFWTRPASFGLAPFEYAQSYKLSGERNAIRSGELHHIDHPLFGALIRITPAPEPEFETGTENAGGPAG